MTGQSAPLGATLANGGVNFSIFSRHASGVDLLFFDQANDNQPARVISLDPAVNAPIITGMFLYQDCNRTRSMPTA
jgi:glycogen operon protein